MTREEEALQYAREAHAGQFDKAGKPYIEHPMRVAAGIPDEAGRIVAYLHDTVEDTAVTVEDIRLRFGEEIAEAVEHLTRREGEGYQDYVRRAAENPLAKRVKMADLCDNMNLSRIPEPGPEDIRRIREKYLPAMKLLLKTW